MRSTQALPLCLLLLVAPLCGAQEVPDHSPDSVISFSPGQGAGYGEEYYPGNVLGLPDITGRDSIPSIDPEQVLTLGIGGEIILRFGRNAIVDGPGADFTVFENAFRYSIGGTARLYAEPAEVSVSRDGIAFIAFPFDSLSLDGCAGVTPTRGDQNPFDPMISGGDAFDLASVGVDTIRYVRLRDRSGMIKSNQQHPFYDFTLNGFDLDAVVGVNMAEGPVSAFSGEEKISFQVSLSPNPMYGASILRFHIPQRSRCRVRLVNVLGEEVESIFQGEMPAGAQALTLNGAGVPSGSYLVSIEVEGVGYQSTRIYIVR